MQQEVVSYWTFPKVGLFDIAGGPCWMYVAGMMGFAYESLLLGVVLGQCCVHPLVPEEEFLAEHEQVFSRYCLSWAP